MSEWTVSSDAQATKAEPQKYDSDHVDLLKDVLQRVGVDDDDEGVPSNFVSPSKANNKRESSNDSPLAESGVPVPLNPSDLTPSKDPYEGLAAWVRVQPTPGSRQSPTPTGTSPFQPSGQGQGQSPAAGTGGYVPRPLNFTPQKSYGSFSRPSDTVFGNNNSSNTPTRGVQQALMPNGTPMQLGTPTSQYPNGEGMYGGGYGGYGNGGSGYGGGGMYSPGMEHDRMYDPYGGPMSIESIRGRVYEIAKDQHGCRFLQRLLDSSYDGGEIAQQIMVEIVPHVAELMTDQYANFLVQKLFDLMPQDVRFNVAEVAAPYMSQIALTPHGTFSIQKLIETIATREEMEIVQQALAKDVVELVKDVHGNHVIQKVLQRFEHDDKQFIYDAMADDCVPIATNKQGCCVLQRCLEFASAEQRIMLVRAVVDSSQLLVQDPFGNYVVQYVLEANDIQINDAIAKVLLPNFMPLCMNKFSSNVVEKILRLISPVVRDEFIAQLKDPNVLSHLLQDDYGNYVVQTSLNVATPTHADILVQLIRPQMHLIRNAPYAKKLEAKMDLVVRKQRGNMRHSYSAGGFSARSGDSPMSYSPSSHGGSGHPSPSYARDHSQPYATQQSSGVPMGHLQNPASPTNGNRPQGERRPYGAVLQPSGPPGSVVASPAAARDRKDSHSHDGGSGATTPSHSAPSNKAEDTRKDKHARERDAEHREMKDKTQRTPPRADQPRQAEGGRGRGGATGGRAGGRGGYSTPQKGRRH